MDSRALEFSNLIDNVLRLLLIIHKPIALIKHGLGHPLRCTPRRRGKCNVLFRPVSMNLQQRTQNRAHRRCLAGAGSSSDHGEAISRSRSQRLLLILIQLKTDELCRRIENPRDHIVHGLVCCNKGSQTVIYFLNRTLVALEVPSALGKHKNVFIELRCGDIPIDTAKKRTDRIRVGSILLDFRLLRIVYVATLDKQPTHSILFHVCVALPF